MSPEQYRHLIAERRARPRREQERVMEKSDLTMGMRVTAADRLIRHVDHKRKRDGMYGRRGGDWKGWVYVAARWVGVDRPKPVEGIVVGVRTVHEWGWRSWQGEEGILWEPEGPKRVMVLVAENLRHDPARVWLEDIVPNHTDGSES